MKKVLIGSVALLLILGIPTFVVISISEKWQGVSENSRWKVTYEPDGTSHGTWNGTLQWKGKDAATLHNIQFLINGQSVLGYTENENMEETIEDQWTFGAFGEKPKQHDQVYVVLKWGEGNQTFTEQIELKP